MDTFKITIADTTYELTCEEIEHFDLIKAGLLQLDGTYLCELEIAKPLLGGFGALLDHIRTGRPLPISSKEACKYYGFEYPYENYINEVEEKINNIFEHGYLAEPYTACEFTDEIINFMDIHMLNGMITNYFDKGYTTNKKLLYNISYIRNNNKNIEENIHIVLLKHLDNLISHIFYEDVLKTIMCDNIVYDHMQKEMKSEKDYFCHDCQSYIYYVINLSDDLLVAVIKFFNEICGDDPYPENFIKFIAFYCHDEPDEWKCKVKEAFKVHSDEENYLMINEIFESL